MSLLFAYFWGTYIKVSISKLISVACMLYDCVNGKWTGTHIALSYS